MSEAIPYVAAPFTGGASLLGAKPVKNMLGKALTAPAPPESPQPITTETRAVQQAAADAAQRRGRGRGASSTILSGFLNQSQGQLKPTMGI